MRYRHLTSRIPVAILGAGAMGQRHARVLAGLVERFELVGVFDARREAASAVASTWGTAAFDSEADAIACSELLVIATPNAAHASAAAAALTAGRHVLVEKPICSTAAEAQALVALETKTGARIFVGHSERFNPVVRVLARVLRGQEVLALDFTRVGVRTQPALAGTHDGGVLVNLAVHDLDLAAYLTGSPVQVRSASGRSLSGLHARGAAEDLAHVLLTTGAGAPGHIYVDRTAPKKRRSLAVVTQRWTYDADLLAHRLTRTTRATGEFTEMPLPVDEPLVAQALAVADALGRGGERPRLEIAVGRDGALALALAERAALYVREPRERVLLAENL